jgi:uncharacterized protein YukE
MGNSSRVDILTLEDFRTRLDSRLADARSILDTLNNKLQAQPALGRFQHATSTASNYQAVYNSHVQRARRLVAAIEAAQSATDSIIRNYRTTEARNAANQADIANVLGGVNAALEGTPDGG